MQKVLSGKNRLNGKVTEEPKPLRLDLGCGQNKRPDFTGVDIAKVPGVDVVHDLFKFPWPFKDGCVEEVHASHFFEHVPAKLRFRFMDELWRILKLGGKSQFICPYWSSMRSVQDTTHEWPPICEASFLYFNKEWRKANKLDHYPVSCNFNFSYGYGISPEWQTRSEETRSFAARNYVNSAMDLHVTLEKIG